LNMVSRVISMVFIRVFDIFMLRLRDFSISFPDSL
jgi:hypothetical protein